MEPTTDNLLASDPGGSPASDSASGSASPAEPDFQAFASEPAAKKAASVQKRQRAPRQKSEVRKHVEVAMAIVKMSAPNLKILSASVGETDLSPVDLAVTVIEAGPKGMAPIAALLAVADADPIEAGILATGLTEDKAMFKAAWAVLGALVPDLPATPPAIPAKAGLRLARETQGLDKTALTNLRSIASTVA